MSHESIAALIELGLNSLEAEVYIALLTSQPMTGYAVAHKLEKPTANVYKALESLSRQGAVMTQEGETRLYAPVPAAEFMRHLEQHYLTQTKRVETALQTLKPVENFGGVYQLQSADLVLERAKAMLERCEKVAILDLFPATLAWLRPAIERLISRGVWVRLQVYQPVQIEGADVVVSPFSEMVLRDWPGQQLNIVVDSRETLIALLEHSLSHVHQAIYSNSRYLAFIVHLGLHHEHNMQRLIDLRDSNDNAAVLNLVKNFGLLEAHDVPGLSELLRRNWDEASNTESNADITAKPK